MPCSATHSMLACRPPAAGEPSTRCMRSTSAESNIVDDARELVRSAGQYLGLRRCCPEEASSYVGEADLRTASCQNWREKQPMKSTVGLAKQPNEQEERRQKQAASLLLLLPLEPPPVVRRCHRHRHRHRRHHHHRCPRHRLLNRDVHSPVFCCHLPVVSCTWQCRFACTAMSMSVISRYFAF